MSGPRTKGLAAILVLAGIVTMVATACGGGPEGNPEKLIPDGSNLIAQVNLNGLLSSNGLMAVVSTVTADQENPLSVDDILVEIIRETGIDLSQFSQAALFTDTDRFEDFAGLIAKGEFDELSLISAIRSAVDGRLVSAPYKESLIYSIEDETDAPSISILEEGILVVGTGEAVRAVIDVQRGDRDPVSGDLVEAFDDLGGGLFRLEVAVPEDFLTDSLPFLLGSVPFLGGALSEDGALGQLGALDSLEDLSFVGLALAQNGQILILRINLEFDSQDSAESISSLLGGLITLAAGFSPAPELTALLEKLEIGRNDAQVSIRLEIEGPELADLITSLTNVTETETRQVQEPPLRTLRKIDEGDATPEPQRVPRMVSLGDEIPIMPTSFHVPIGEEVNYSTTPPTSGDHWERWAECGFYPEGLTDETITHNLEHGNIVASYNLPLQGQVDRLQAVIDNIASSAGWGVTRYYDEIPEGQVVMSAWGRMYVIGGIDQESMEAFFSLYAGALGPERIPC